DRLARARPADPPAARPRAARAVPDDRGRAGGGELMARAAVSIRLDGVADLNKMLEDLAPNEADNLLRTTVHGIAGVARDRIAAAAPFKHLRRGFQALRRRGQKGKPVSEVRARSSANDWRWFEFGTAERVQKT